MHIIIYYYTNYKGKLIIIMNENIKAKINLPIKVKPCTPGL